MKKILIRLLTIALVIVLGIGAWFYFYFNQKNPDNIPSKELMVTYLLEKGEDYASEELAGYTINQLTQVWGDPDGELSGMYGYIWNYEDADIIIYTEDDDVITNAKISIKSLK